MLVLCRETELCAAFPVYAVQKEENLCSPIILPLLVVGMGAVA